MVCKALPLVSSLFLSIVHLTTASLASSTMQEMQVQSLGWDDPMEKGVAYQCTYFQGSDAYAEKAMAPHASTLAWKTPWTEELGRLQSMGSLCHDLRFLNVEL